MLSFFPRGVLDEILNLIESVSEGFPSYSLLSNLGFYEVWLNQSVGNMNVFLKGIRVRLTDNFVQNWSSRITESSRANFYSLVSNLIISYI